MHRGAVDEGYVAFILDVFSRMVTGWQVSTSLRTDLALDALDMGLWSRKRAGQDVAGLTHHSDRASNSEQSVRPSGSHIQPETSVSIPTVKFGSAWVLRDDAQPSTP